MKLTISQAHDLAHRAMTSCGHSETEAAVIADHLLDCELRGLSYGGLARALSIIERKRQIPQPPRPITIIRETPVSASIDGGDQVGYLVAQRATEIALSKARTTGIAAVGANQTWYTGMFSYYLEQITAAGLVGVIAGSGPHVVAPHGGTESRFGTNPIAFGFPTAGAPLIWDIGTSSITLAEVMLHERLGHPLSGGLAYSASGSPTLDPSEALAGAFTVWGGHRGSGLALTVQLLGMLTGAAAAPVGLSDCGFFLSVWDPALFTDPDDFKRRAAAYADSIRTTRPLDSTEPVRVPFERSSAHRDAQIAQGDIEVQETVYDKLTAVLV
ncbi:LDH2 family malate/lactate/ureidoglycolate dehydrogenase [Rhodococcus sp. OAS809]|uniref:Ldh family oxidoreductase n=1 Tax=Rhodococcus sp. OAS809 TaxID=2663874 RepID=UPI00178A737D